MILVYNITIWLGLGLGIFVVGPYLERVLTK